LKVFVKKVAFPKEHGSWGFVLEPLLLSLLVSYSTKGLLLAIASFFIFLNHQPVRVLFDNDKKITKQLKHTAIIFFSTYAIITLISIYKVFINTSIINLFPFILSIFFMTMFLFLEFQKKGRELLAEFIAPLSITLIGISIVLLGGWNIYYALAFSIILLSRSIPTVFYIHIKVQHFKKRIITKKLLYISEFISVILIAVLIFLNLIPKFSIIAVAMLLLRAFYGLSKNGLLENIKILGIKEFIYGLLYVAIIYIGYNYNL